MTTNRDSKITGEQARELMGPPRAITYDQAATRYRCTIDARERFEELSNRDLMVQVHARLKALDTYDPHKHGDVGRYPPLTADEHLELLAAGEMLARYYRHPALIHHAVEAGASWAEIAAATGSDEAQVRQGYREWADGQHRLYGDYQAKFGLNDTEHTATISRAAEPQASEHDQDWAGPGFTGPGVEPGTPRAEWVARLLRQLSDLVFAGGDAFARENGWQITKTTGRFGLGARSYRDPRFSPRTAAAHQSPEYSGRGFNARSG
jgi:hypothetical protein